MFISSALAQTATPGGFGSNPMDMMVMIGVPMVVFLFMSTRSQSKRAKEHQAMLAGLKRGDYVVTGGGLIGKVVKLVGDDEIQIELAEGVRVRVVKATITGVRAKPEPVKKGKGPLAEPANDEDEEAAGEGKQD